MIALNEAEAKIEKVTELVKLIQGKLTQMIKDAPSDVAEACKLILEECGSISSASDLDYLFLKLKGTGAEEMLKAIENDDQESEDSKVDNNPEVVVVERIDDESS